MSIINIVFLNSTPNPSVSTCAGYVRCKAEDLDSGVLQQRLLNELVNYGTHVYMVFFDDKENYLHEWTHYHFLEEEEEFRHEKLEFEMHCNKLFDQKKHVLVVNQEFVLAENIPDDTDHSHLADYQETIDFLNDFLLTLRQQLHEANKKRASPVNIKRR